MTLKAQMLTDVNMMMNLDEHAETITVNGKPIVAIVEPEEDSVEQNQFTGAAHVKDLRRIYTGAAAWLAAGLDEPHPPRKYTIDGKLLTVDKLDHSAGLYTIYFRTITRS